jgi:glycosyltransferase involved in cell wall biosynthesis
MKLAVVIPWFGRDLKGGAEQQAWQIASRLAARKHDVEVLTTCCRSFQDDWATNHLPPGEVKEPEGFRTRRFPVDERDRASFDAACSNLLNLPREILKPGVSPVSPDDAQKFVDELVKSSALQQFLVSQREHFDAFIFLPYLYGPIIHGIMAVGDRACLQPCLHDEAYAYLPQVADAFYRAGKLFFNSEGEAELALRLFGPAIATKSVVIGEGVETGSLLPSNEHLEPAALGRFVLYLGRKEAGKNTDLLIRAFSQFRRVRPNSALRLVFAGHGSVELNGCRDCITDVGLISDAQKEQLLDRCLALAQPSVNESFSRAMMEAWHHGKPVAVNGRCLATSIEARRANGGWIAENEDDWAALFVEIDRATPDELQRLGGNGKRHAEVVADWDKVMQRYEHELILITPATPPGPSIRAKTPLTINQFLPNLSYGDAISNEAITIRDHIRTLGFRSDIYARFIDPKVAHECHPFSVDALQASDAAIYHHSIGTEITPHVVRFSRPKCLIYHNITPAEFFDDFRPPFADILRKGREDLPVLAPNFLLSYGDSAYNAQELAQSGFHKPKVLPICINPEKWAFLPEPELMRRLSDGRTNIIFVGRIAPNKKQDDLITGFAHYLALDPTARLFIIGAAERDDPYAAYLFEMITRRGLTDAVHVTGSVSEGQLAAYYRTAHLFWCMSEHEGFCAPLIEAMWFDVPVLAFRSSAVPETLGKAALMFTDKTDLAAVAAVARSLITEPKMRETLIRSQRRQRITFLSTHLERILTEAVEQMLLEKGKSLGSPDLQIL